jgi:SAM-dependent methyltransferase
VTESCDLCGAAGGRLLQAASPRALRSDRRIVPGPLQKIECERCGLVRAAPHAATGEAFYAHDYHLDRGDHVFMTAEGPVRRSAVMADWIEQLTLSAGIDLSGRRVFEIGAGRGYLLAELASRWPAARCSGMELSVEAAGEARAQGLDVTPVPLHERAPGADVVIAIAVLEHVPSPTDFLRAIRRVLAPGGYAVLIQPTQDVPSYDVLFIDHLHHFGMSHVRGLARKCGFDTVGDQVGFRLMPNFSAHLLCAADAQAWDASSSRTCAAKTVARVTEDLARFAQEFRRVKAAGRRVGVFGLHEAFAVVRAYSGIEAADITVGLADDLSNPEYRELPFPVAGPEACAGLGVNDVFLTMNAVHYPYASSRLAGLGLRAIPVFR